MKKYIFTLVLFMFVFRSVAETNMYAPTLVAPANNAVGIMPDILLNWNAVPGAWTYKLQVATDTGFTSPLVVVTASTASQMTYLIFGAKYYWRVKAIGVGDSSAWSSRFSFTVIDAVTLTSPADSSVNNMVGFPFQWTALTGITHYQWEVDTVNTFDSPLHVRGTVAGSRTIDTTSQLHFGLNYWLRMRAYHNLDTSNWGTSRFVGIASAFLLKRPLNNFDTLHGVQIQMRWNTIGSDLYDVMLGYDSLFSSPVTFTSTAANYFNGLNRGESPTLYFDTVYYWTVRARNSYDTSAWMPFRAFQTIDKVKLDSPANATTGELLTPEFKWYSIIGTDTYVLEYDTVASFTNPTQVTLIADSVTYPFIQTISYTPTVSLYVLKNYYWRVKSVTTLEESPWSDVRTFTTKNDLGIANQVLNNNQISLYPNPCKGKLNVDIVSTQSTDVNLRLANILGQDVITEKVSLKAGSNTVALHLDDLTNGIYVLKIQTGSQTITRKVVLDK